MTETLMTFPDDTAIAELERALSDLASNPLIPNTDRRRLIELQSAVSARRLAKDNQLLSESALDRFELVMGRLQIAVQARKKDLELQLRQYDEREKRVAQVLDAIADHRKKREKADTAQGRRSGRSTRKNRVETRAAPSE